MLTRRQKVTHWTVQHLEPRCPGAIADLRSVLGRPTVQDLSLAAPFFRDALSCLRALVTEVNDPRLQDMTQEFEEVETHLAQRQADTALVYPANFPVLRQTGLLLYSMVRLTQPRIMLESGVADGYSTAITLAAMQRNGLGELHSFDIRDDVGALVGNRARWYLHVSTAKQPFRDLRSLAYQLRPLDIFFHDSDHRFVPQVREYDLAEETVKSGGYLISDDVDFSYAFLKRVEGGGRCVLLLDDIKCSGILQLGENLPSPGPAPRPVSDGSRFSVLQS